MKRIVMVLTVMAVMVAMSVGSAMPAFAYANINKNDNLNARNAPGFIEAGGNCTDTRFRQIQNGQTGDETGSPNDPKQAGGGVTNCAHQWQ